MVEPSAWASRHHRHGAVGVGDRCRWATYTIGPHADLTTSPWQRQIIMVGMAWQA